MREEEGYLTNEQHQYLTDTLRLYEKQDFITTISYFNLILERTTEFKANEEESLINLLKSYGAYDYMYDLYASFYKRDEVKANQTFDEVKNLYDYLMADYVESQLEEVKNTFPILTYEIVDKCMRIDFNSSFHVTSPEYKEGKIEVESGIFLYNDINGTFDITFNSSSSGNIFFIILFSFSSFLFSSSIIFN